MKRLWDRLRARRHAEASDAERRWRALPEQGAFLARHPHLDGAPGCPRCRRPVTYEVPLTGIADPRRVVICPAYHEELYRAFDAVGAWPPPAQERRS